MNITLNSPQIRGFFEGDGGIQVRIDKTKYSLSFRSQAKFGQTTPNDQILEWVRHSLFSSSTITNYEETNSSSLVIPFNSDAGEKFLQMYLKNKPVNPGTYKDFLIALLIHEYEMKQILPLSANSASVLQNKSNEERKRMEVLTLLWLSFQRPAKRQTKTTLPIEHYHKHLNATPQEISEAERLGNELLAPISSEVSKLVSDLDNDKIQICADFVSYYHVADGGLSFNFHKRKLANDRRNIRIEPRWTITDDKLAEPLLKRIIRQYNFTRYQPIVNGKSGYAVAQGWTKASEVVVPFFKNKKMLPDAIAIKAQNFIKVCEMHFNEETFINANLYRSYILQAYFCNSESSYRTEESFNKDYRGLMESIITEKGMSEAEPSNSEN